MDIAGSHVVSVSQTTTNFAIDCKASGEPPLTVQWYHDGVPVSRDPTHVILPDNTLLVLSISRPADYGRYMCVASNIYGSDNATVLGKCVGVVYVVLNAFKVLLMLIVVVLEIVLSFFYETV